MFVGGWRSSAVPHHMFSLSQSCRHFWNGLLLPTGNTRADTLQSPSSLSHKQDLISHFIHLNWQRGKQSNEIVSHFFPYTSGRESLNYKNTLTVHSVQEEALNTGGLITGAIPSHLSFKLLEKFEATDKSLNIFSSVTEMTMFCFSQHSSFYLLNVLSKSNR